MSTVSHCQICTQHKSNNAFSKNQLKKSKNNRKCIKCIRRGHKKQEPSEQKNDNYYTSSDTSITYWTYNCTCGEVFDVSANQYAKRGWGSMMNFLLSYGLKPTPDGFKNAHSILQQFIEMERSKFIEIHKSCVASTQKDLNKSNGIKITIRRLLEENDPSFSLKVDPKCKVQDIVKIIHHKYDYPIPQIQVSVYINDKQVVMKNDKSLNEYGISDNARLFWLSVPRFLLNM
eukprot:276256_1